MQREGTVAASGGPVKARVALTRVGRYLVVCIAVWCWSGTALSEPAAQLSATAHQLRVAANDPIAIVPLKDTTWWITVQARRGGGGAPLEALEYHAKFTDGPDARTRTGTIELNGADREAFSGRIDVICQTRPDYLRPLRVRLRVRDLSETSSEWVDVSFPVSDSDAAPLPTNPPPVTTEQETARSYETIGTVEVEVDDDTTMTDVREGLQRKAVERGGDAVVGFRLVSSAGARNIFAAEVIRYVDPAAAPTPVPTAGAFSRVLGEIRMSHERR